LIKGLLSGPDGGLEVVIVESRIDDVVAAVFQIGRLHTAWYRMPSMKE
jgi:hypothetical protein